MQNTDVIIIGGGQAGLVMSRSLSARGIDHVVLERGRTGERWHSQRWDSMRLLTPAAQSALPGLPQTGADPGAFLTAQAFATYLRDYARTIAAPVTEGVEVSAVEAAGAGFRISTSAGVWQSRAVVVATGACDTPFRPAMAQQLAPGIHQVAPADYKRPSDLPDGGVLIVGASSTGIQLAEEIHTSGRPVTLAVGDHTRMPRRYRGRDIFDWMELAGILDDRADESRSLEAARQQPSLQLVGRQHDRDLDLASLSRDGVRLVGRLAAVSGTFAGFHGDLAETTAQAHARMLRVLNRIDASIERIELAASLAGDGAPMPFLATCDPITLDLVREGLRTVVWATGYVRRYPWLKVPILDARGEIVHCGGVTAVPGLYALGLTFLRRRRSSFISGCGLDAEELAPEIEAHLNMQSRRAA